MLAFVRITAPGVRYVLLRGLLAVCLVLPLIQPKLALTAFDDADWLDASRAGVSLPWPNRITTPGDRSDSNADAARLRRVTAWARWLLLVLVAGAALRVAWIGAGLVRLRRLRSAGEEAPVIPEYDELQVRIGTRAQVRFVPQLEQPVTFGVRRPVVLLPDRLRQLPTGIQRAVLAHELWHVRHYDWIWVLFEELVRAALWFQPAVWMPSSPLPTGRACSPPPRSRAAVISCSEYS
jgi:hypothetical protein